MDGPMGCLVTISRARLEAIDAEMKPLVDEREELRAQIQSRYEEATQRVIAITPFVDTFFSSGPSNLDRYYFNDNGNVYLPREGDDGAPRFYSNVDASMRALITPMYREARQEVTRLAREASEISKRVSALGEQIGVLNRERERLSTFLATQEQEG